MTKNINTDVVSETVKPNQPSALDDEKTDQEEKKEKKSNLTLDDSDNSKGFYNFYPIEALDFKETPVRHKELHRFQNILNAPFVNVPLLVVEQQEDVLPLFSIYIHNQLKSGKKTSLFSVTPSDFGMDFADEDYCFELNKTLNMGSTIIEEGDLKHDIPVYCDLLTYNNRDVLGTFVGNFLKNNKLAILIVRKTEIAEIRRNVEQDRLISGGLENPEMPYEPKGLARASEIKISPMTLAEKLIYFTHHLLRIAFDNNLICSPKVCSYLIKSANNRFQHKDIFFKVFEAMNQIVVATQKMGKDSISKSIATKVLNEMAPLHDRTKELADLDTRLKKKIFGQDTAIESCYETILSRLDDEHQDKPTVIAFFGPSGVGKTALAEEISLALSGKKASVVNMAEYADSFKVSILTGSSKGYVDSDEDGLLAKIVKANPKAVLVLDEFEKAHPQVQHMFLGIFDKGSLFDNHSGQIDMSQTTIILTSNAGVNANTKIGFDQSSDPIYVADEKSVHQEFPPELLGRIDSKIFFNPLTDEILDKIVDKFMAIIKPRFDKLGIRVILTPDSKNELIQKGKDPSAGARPLLALIRQKIKTPIEIAFLKKHIKRGDTVVIDDVSEKKMHVLSKKRLEHTIDSVQHVKE